MPSSPGGILPKGSACLSCRQRKMRCDGVRPVCGPCNRAKRTVDCQYTDLHQAGRITDLEDRIAFVEGRIRALEAQLGSDSIGSPVALHQPYAYEPQWLVVSSEEFSASKKSELIESFLSFASEIGFFLNVQRFREAAVTSKTASPALLSAVYLWGGHFSGSAPGEQKILLTRASTQVGMTIATHKSSSSAVTPSDAREGRSTPARQAVIETIQTHILLAYYHLAFERVREGYYYVSHAVSLLVSARRGGVGMVVGEEEECWTSVGIAEHLWAVTLGTSSASQLRDGGLEGEEDGAYNVSEPIHLNSSTSASTRTRRTLNAGERAEAPSTKALLLKAAQILGRCSAGTGNHDMNQALLDNLHSNLFPPAKLPLSDRTPENLRRLFVAHSLAHAVSIRLNWIRGVEGKGSSEGGEGARNKAAFTAAQTMFRMVSTSKLGAMTKFINPFMGYVWHQGGRVLLEALLQMRSTGTRHTEPTDAENDLRELVEDALEQMRMLAPMCRAINTARNSLVQALADIPA